MNIHGKISQLSRVFRAGKFNAQMDDEMRLHLELREERLIAGGMSPEEARYAAARVFGGIEQLKGRARDQRTCGWIEDAWQDMRYGFRMMRRNPVFTTVAISSLALGIGMATGVFTLVNAILLGSLPVPNPQELRVIDWVAKGSHMGLYVASGDPVVPDKQASGSFSTEVFRILRSHCADVADIFGYQYFPQVAGRALTETFNLSVVTVSGNYFSALRLQPALGELLGSEDERVGAAQRVVLSHQIWERYFNSDPASVGKSLLLNNRPFVIVGVLPAKFLGVTPGQTSDVYTSLPQRSLFATMPESPDFWWLEMMARLKPGVNGGQLKPLLDVNLAGSAGKFLTSPETLITDGRDGPIWNRQDIRTQLNLLFTMTGLVVLVACANLAGLLIARGASRRYELALRESLGAGRGRLTRQLLTETFLLCLLGGGLGLEISIWVKMAISHWLSGTSEDLPYDTSFSFRVFFFTCLATVLTTVLAGLLPSLKASRRDPQTNLKARDRRWLQHFSTGRALVALQIAVSLLIATGAALYARTLFNVMRLDPGFRIDHVLTFGLQMGNTYSDQQSLSFVNEVHRAVSAIPGVESATILSFPLLGNGRAVAQFSFADHPAMDGPAYFTDFLLVGDTFFQTMKIPLLRGRELQASDTPISRKVMVINEAFARKYFPDGNALGRTLNLDGAREIVGVCGNLKTENIKREAQPAVYMPFAQQSHTQPWACFALRTKVLPLAIAQDVRKAVQIVDPGVPILNLSTEEQLRDQNIVSERMFAKFSGALTLVVLILSSIGLYGLVAYDVAGRTREMGIRTALGARRMTLIGATLRRAILLTVTGITIGIPLTFLSSRLIRAQLYGVTPSDPSALVGACLLLLTVALVAAWIPIRRATKVDPMAALRGD